MAAALSKAARLTWIKEPAARLAWNAFLEDWGSLVIVETNARVVERAAELAWSLGLRGYEAVHLAGAQVWQESLGVEVTLGAFDQVLANAGRQSGLAVWPETSIP